MIIKKGVILSVGENGTCTVKCDENDTIYNFDLVKNWKSKCGVYEDDHVILYFNHNEISSVVKDEQYVEKVVTIPLSKKIFSYIFQNNIQTLTILTIIPLILIWLFVPAFTASYNKEKMDVSFYIITSIMGDDNLIDGWHKYKDSAIDLNWVSVLGVFLVIMAFISSRIKSNILNLFFFLPFLYVIYVYKLTVDSLRSINQEHIAKEVIISGKTILAPLTEFDYLMLYGFMDWSMFAIYLLTIFLMFIGFIKYVGYGNKNYPSIEELQ